MESPRYFTTLEEEIYWKNFHFAQFSLVLPPDFQHSLTLPKKFTNYLRQNLPDNATLKVNGVTWNVCLEKCKDTVLLKGNGWQQFAKAYSLRKRDILIFKYNRCDCFEIMIFDSASSCEKESSFFVRNSPSPQCNNADAERVRETSSEFIDKSQYGDYDSDYAAFVNKLRKKSCGTSKERDGDFDYAAFVNKRSKNTCGTSKEHSFAKAANYCGDYDEVYDKKISISNQRRAREVASNAMRKRELIDIDIQVGDCEEASDKQKPVSEQHTTQKRAYRHRVRKMLFSAQRKRACNGSDRSTPKSYQGRYFKSNRRPVTEEEKQKALDMAVTKSAEYKDSFFVVMRPTSVYKRFYMTIPAEARFKNRLKNGQRWILKVEDRTWICAVSEGGIQGSGLMNFALDNNLEEFDVCLFVPQDGKDGNLVFNVSIFRVVSEVVPPTSY